MSSIQSIRRMGLYQALTPQFKRLADEYGVEEVIKGIRRVGGDPEKVMISLEINRQNRQMRNKYWVNIKSG